MKIIVTGGRKYYDRATVNRVLLSLKPTRLIVGCSTGADELAFNWAGKNRVTRFQYFADWDRYLKSAGPRRNQKMVDEHRDSDLLVAFPGNIGTADMVSRARAAGIKVFEVTNG